MSFDLQSFSFGTMHRIERVGVKE